MDFFASLGEVILFFPILESMKFSSSMVTPSNGRPDFGVFLSVCLSGTILET